jgi:hypothetical protein
MNKVWYVILLSLFFLSPIKEKEYPYKNGIPTSRGIEYYVKLNEQKIVNEYQAFVKDTLYDYYISTDNLSLYMDYDSLESGRFYIPNEIIITNELKYTDYELALVPKWKRKSLVESNQFVKAVLIHELTHVYFFQVMDFMKIMNMEVAMEYNYGIRMYPNMELRFGSEFIEEGICEYMVQKMNESIPYQNIYQPKTKEDIRQKYNYVDIKYKYSSWYVKEFMDLTIQQYGDIKTGIMIILSNKPPTYEEILNPNLFFNRLQFEYL